MELTGVAVYMLLVAILGSPPDPLEIVDTRRRTE
jgi:hypothetical protein